MDGTETEHVGDFADGILVFPNELLTLLQFDIEQIVFGRAV